MSSSDWVQLVPLLLLIVLFWLLVIRPGRKRQREFVELQSQLEPGQQVMLTSGIHGELVSVDEGTVQLRIAPDVVVTVARPAVGTVVDPEEPLLDDVTDDASEDER